MNVFNSAVFRDSALTTYGFPAGHVFAIRDPEEVLYEHVSHDKLVLHARPVANPALSQVFTQEEFRAPVEAGRVDPRVEENSLPRRRVRARNPDVASARDLPDDEKAELSFYWKLCRRITQMHDEGETSLSDLALARAIPRVMAELVLGVGDGSDDGRRKAARRHGRSAPRAVHEINARKTVDMYAKPAPSTVRRWLRALRRHEWDMLALRDHRKGRAGHRAPKVTEPESVAVMAKWVQAYLDRSRPSVTLLYRLMVGSVDLQAANARQDMRGMPSLEVRDAVSFAEVNASREAEGLPTLPVPSKSTFERAIRKLDRFQVMAAREGHSAARRRFKVAGRREAVLAPGERVSVDCWKVQLMSVKLPHEFWAGLPDDLAGKLAALRLTLCVAIDEATKVVLGVRLAVTASGDVSMRTLEMVCRNKDEIARAAGCRSSWHHACTPMTVATDSGPEFIDAGFRCAVRDVGAANEIGPAKHPDARGVIERFFLTLDAQLMPHFQGRTFSGVDDKGDYKPGDFANVLVETLGRALVRYVVDVYHNSPHAGLGGQTPNDAWEDQSARYEVLPPPPPHRLRTVFGFSDNRRIQNRGVRFLGLFYRSEKLARLRARIGQADVRIRADLENLGAIWVSENVPGAEWIAADCDLPMEGVSAWRWLRAAALLRSRHADSAKLREDVVLAAIADLRAEGRRSSAEAGLGPSTVSREDLLAQEDKNFRHFSIEEAEERGRSFEGFHAVETDDDGDAVDLGHEGGGADSDEEPRRKVNRRRGRLGTDFL